MNRIIIYLTFIWIFIAQSGVAFSQDSVLHTSRNYGWFDAGIGAVKAPGFSGPGGILAFSHLSQLGLFTVRFVAAEQFSGMYPGNVNFLQPRQFYEFGLLYGKAFNSDFLFASGSGGISFVSGSYQMIDEEYKTIGLPLEVQIFVIPLPVLAFGIKCVVNINDKSMFTAGMFCLRVGALRYTEQRE